jgi:fermentation-respiration switch protein FrsA (DUF1100 family)
MGDEDGAFREAVGRGRWRRFRWVAAVIGAVYLLVFATVDVASRVLLFPPRGVVPTYGATARFLDDGGDRIHVLTARSTDAEPTAFVLRFYGNADRADRHVASEARSYAPRAVEVWGVNYVGFGESTGKASLAGVARAADRAFEAISIEAKGRPIYAAGTSMGTTAALHLAATKEIAGVLLHDGPPLPQLLRGEHGLWNLWLIAVPVSLQVPTAVSNLDNAARASAKAVFITSENDTLVPAKYQRLVYDAYRGPKRLVTVPGVDHVGSMSEEKRTEVKSALKEMWAL